MFETPQFFTGPFEPRKVFLPDREYGLALDALVKGCSDVLVVSSDGERVLLGLRKVEPQPDWWFIGGRARPGDTTSVAAARNVKRELGLEFPPSRFSVVANYSMVWSYRQQPPVENGTADLSTIHELRLTDEEEKNGTKVELDPEEYLESKWWSIDEVVEKGEGEVKRFHPCLVSSLKALRAKRALIELEKAADGNQDGNTEEGEITKKALAFVKALREAKATEASVKVTFDPDACKYSRQEEEDNNDNKKRKKSHDLMDQDDSEEEKKC